MPTGAKPNHSAAFNALHAGLAPSFLAAGLRPHPVWPPGWDAHKAHYAAEYLAPPAPDGIRRVTLIYGPADKGWHLLGLFHPCPDATTRLAKGGTLAGPKWADCLHGLPFRQTDMIPWRKRLFWRVWVKRQLRFDRAGNAVALDSTLAAALNSWPEFLKLLNRAGAV